MKRMEPVLFLDDKIGTVNVELERIVRAGTLFNAHNVLRLRAFSLISTYVFVTSQI